MIRRGDTVALFLPIRDEIETEGLFDTAWQAGGHVLLPAITGKAIVFRHFEPGDPLVDGGFGTRQPAEMAAPGEPDLIVAPLAAFDRLGNRIGYGGGYYDRVTGRLERAGHDFRYCGLAFACQEVEAIPAEEHDRRLDAVATELGVTSFREQT